MTLEKEEHVYWTSNVLKLDLVSGDQLHSTPGKEGCVYCQSSM